MTTESDHVFEDTPLKWRLARRLRALRNIRGMQRLRRNLLGEADGNFRIRNRQGTFEGNLNSFIERLLYLDGGYEEEEIDLFLSIVAKERCGTMLDIGSNVGTHAVAFSQVFETVHAFEPNPAVLPRLKRNVALNAAEKIEVHAVALSDSDSVMPLYSTGSDNNGLGTLSDVDQYDSPIHKTADVRVCNAAPYIMEHVSGTIDAIKIDVQGHERAVLSGLRPILERDNPLVWVELDEGFYADAESKEELAGLLSGKRAYRMSLSKGVKNSYRLEPSVDPNIRSGNYVYV